MIKIFSLHKIIYLINNSKDFKPTQHAILVEIESIKKMNLIYTNLINEKKITEIYFFNTDIDLLFDYFSSMFKTIEAAGGLVKNNNNEWLFIFRNGKWDLPKGKIEKKEKIKAAAIREVQEECGVEDLTIVKELPSTYHIYFMEEKMILKRTFWFEMFCEHTSTLIPQLEEGITDVKWISEKGLKQIYDNTFESIIEVMKGIHR